MIKLFEYKIHTDTDEPIPLCWKVFVILFAAFMLLVMAVVCASCQPDNMENEKTESRPAILHLRVTGEEQVDVATRAVSEDAIHDLHILIYDSKGELIGQQYAESSTVTINTHSAGNCTIYAIANTGKKDLFNSYNIHTETALKELTCSISTWDELSGGAYLPMTGSLDKVKIEAGTQTLSGGIKVSRIAAKIKLNIGIKANSGITITDYTIHNIPLKSYYILRPLSTEDQKIDTNTTPAEDAVSASNVADWMDSEIIKVNNTTVSHTIYMLENRRGIKNGISGPEDKTSAKAPQYATYVDINGKAGNITANWKVYLGGNETDNFNIKRNWNYTYNITLNDVITADTRVDIDFTNVIDLSTTGIANCYIAPKSCTWYKINATVRGNGAATLAEISPTGSYIPANATISPTDAELVWETGEPKGVIQSVSLTEDKKYILFKTGHLEEGNAVVAAKDATGIIWSWHIWKTHFDLSTVPTQTYRTTPRHLVGTSAWIYYDGLSSHEYIMMDRNLGASDNIPSNTDDVAQTFGLYYQFGRKDPFPSGINRSNISSDFYDKNGTKANNLKNMMNSTISKLSADLIKYAVNNPATFIAKDDNDKTATGGDGTHSSSNWIYGAFLKTAAWQTSYKLWGGDLSITTESMRLGGMYTGKTIYDPCPYGWCLPRQDTWLNFTTSTDDYNQDAGGVGNVTYYNSPDADKVNYVGGNFKSASVFGRRFYIIGNSGNTAFYPAAGYRYGGGGEFDGIGHVCHVWSSEPFQSATIVGAALNTGVSWVGPVANSMPANGLPVRCVKESSIK